jgi:hypothetical protein
MDVQFSHTVVGPSEPIFKYLQKKNITLFLSLITENKPEISIRNIYNTFIIYQMYFISAI